MPWRGKWLIRFSEYSRGKRSDTLFYGTYYTHDCYLIPGGKVVQAILTPQVVLYLIYNSYVFAPPPREQHNATTLFTGDWLQAPTFTKCASTDKIWKARFFFVEDKQGGYYATPVKVKLSVFATTGWKYDDINTFNKKIYDQSVALKYLDLGKQFDVCEAIALPYIGFLQRMRESVEADESKRVEQQRQEEEAQKAAVEKEERRQALLSKRYS